MKTIWRHHVEITLGAGGGVQVKGVQVFDFWKLMSRELGGYLGKIASDVQTEVGGQAPRIRVSVPLGEDRHKPKPFPWFVAAGYHQWPVLTGQSSNMLQVYNRFGQEYSEQDFALSALRPSASHLYYMEEIEWRGRVAQPGYDDLQPTYALQLEADHELYERLKKERTLVERALRNI